MKKEMPMRKEKSEYERESEMMKKDSKMPHKEKAHELRESPSCKHRKKQE